MSLSPETSRPSLWHTIGRFGLAYLAAVAVSTILVPFGLLTLYPRPNMMMLFWVAFAGVGLFALLPAILVFALVLRRGLRPMRSIVLSAGLVGLVGAVMVETDFFWRFRLAYTNFAFIAAMTVCGLISGLAFWFVAFRAPIRPYWIGRFIPAYLVATMVTGLTMPAALSLMDGSFKLFREFGHYMVSWYYSVCCIAAAVAFIPAVVGFSLILRFRLRPLVSIVPAAGLIGLAGASGATTDVFTRFDLASINYPYIAAVTVSGLIAGLVFWFVAFRGTGFPSRPATSGET